MTINISDLKYLNLENILNDLKNISIMEADLIIQICIHILSNNRNKNNILEVYQKQMDRFVEKGIEESFPKEIDQYKILKYYVEKTQ